METFAERNSAEGTSPDSRDGGEYIIDGTKQWISGVDVADRMVLVARTTPLEEVSKLTQG